MPLREIFAQIALQSDLSWGCSRLIIVCDMANRVPPPALFKLSSLYILKFKFSGIISDEQISGLSQVSVRHSMSGFI